MPHSELAPDLIEYLNEFSNANSTSRELEVVKQYADHQWSVVLLTLDLNNPSVESYEPYENMSLQYSFITWKTDLGHKVKVILANEDLDLHVQRTVRVPTVAEYSSSKGCLIAC